MIIMVNNESRMFSPVIETRKKKVGALYRSSFLRPKKA
jgi:hypothetical protein